MPRSANVCPRNRVRYTSSPIANLDERARSRGQGRQPRAAGAERLDAGEHPRTLLARRCRRCDRGSRTGAALDPNRADLALYGDTAGTQTSGVTPVPFPGR